MNETYGPMIGCEDAISWIEKLTIPAAEEEIRQRVLNRIRYEFKKTPPKGKACMDHKGNTYPSYAEMCRAYNIKPSTFIRRKKYGYSLEKCLTPIKKVSDAHGNEYPSFAAMCRAYNLKPLTVNYRLKRGLSLEEALADGRIKIGPRNTRKKSAVKCMDHKGNHYPSYAEMCKAYNISRFTFAKRKERGWTLEECLAPVQN